MSYPVHQRVVGDVPPRIRPALDVMYEAFQYAGQTTREQWEFAVEVDHLFALGLTLNDLRWLVRKELVEHQREVTLDADDGRVFWPTGDLRFPEGTCFVLTQAGISLALKLGPSTNSLPDVSSASDIGSANLHAALILPNWNSERRWLRLGGATVKQFRCPACNQEAILAAFEEEGWPVRIDDPLSPQPDQDPKQRLSDTIKCLNRKQKTKLICFRGDGTGQAVTWERIEQ